MEEMISKYNETGQWMSFSSWLKKQVKKGVLKASKEELIQIIAMYGFLGYSYPNQAFSDEDIKFVFGEKRDELTHFVCLWDGVCKRQFEKDGFVLVTNFSTNK